MLLTNALIAEHWERVKQELAAFQDAVRTSTDTFDPNGFVACCELDNKIDSVQEDMELIMEYGIAMDDDEGDD